MNSSPPRKLERSRSAKMIGGVCGGVATYLNMDPTLVRILFVAITVFTGGLPILLYLIALFLMPEEAPAPNTGYPSVNSPQPGDQPYSAADFGPPPAAGHPGYAPADRDPMWGSAGAPWEQPAAQAWPHDAAAAPEPPAPSTPAPSTAAPDASTPWQAYPGSGAQQPGEPLPESTTPEPASEEESGWESTPVNGRPEDQTKGS